MLAAGRHPPSVKRGTGRGNEATGESQSPGILKVTDLGGTLDYLQALACAELPSREASIIQGVLGLGYPVSLPLSLAEKVMPHDSSVDS